MTGWPALRIDYHAADQGALLLQVIKPLAIAVRERWAGRRLLARVAWANGPNIIVCIEMDKSEFVAFRELAEPMILNWLQANPSLERFDADEYTTLSAMRARAEGISRPAPGLMPNNTVTAVCHEHGAPLGVAAFGPIRDQFHAAALEPTLNLTEARLQSRALALVEFADVIATLDDLATEPLFSFWPISTRAHSESFLAAYPGTAGEIEALAEKLTPAIVGKWKKAGRFEHTFGSTIGTWTMLLQRLNDDLRDVITPSVLTEARISFATDENSIRKNGGVVLNDEIKAIMRTALHLRFRLMINFIYGLMPIIGLHPYERVVLCSAMWRALQQAYPARVSHAVWAVRCLRSAAMGGTP